MKNRDQFEPYEREVERWMQGLAADPVTAPPLPDSQVLWWKGEALRRMDLDRRAGGVLDAGEYVSVAVGIAAALALLAWGAASAPAFRQSASFLLAGVATVGILGGSIGLMCWDLRPGRPSRPRA